MRLYLLTRMASGSSPVHDVCNAMVVRARSPSHARMVAVKGANFTGKNDFIGDEGAETWLSEAYSTCVLLRPAGPEGVILHNFTAG
jgi:hypothetical protein